MVELQASLAPVLSTLPTFGDLCTCAIKVDQEQKWICQWDDLTEVFIDGLMKGFTDGLMNEEGWKAEEEGDSLWVVLRA